MEGIKKEVKIEVVSILVFLDQALKDILFHGLVRGTGSFNPCFPGSSAESS